jgi:hypothetical protein
LDVQNTNSLRTEYETIPKISTVQLSQQHNLIVGNLGLHFVAVWTETMGKQPTALLQFLTVHSVSRGMGEFGAYKAVR